NPDNTYAKDIDGLELKDVSITKEYQIRLSSYGSYLVTYTLDDNNGTGVTRFTHSIFVDDDVKPEIIVNGSNPKSAKIGQKVTFQKAEAIDNVDGNIDVKYFIVLPGGKIETLNEDMSFTFTLKGEYIIRYFAI